MADQTMPDDERLSRFMSGRVRLVRGFLILTAALLIVSLAGMSCDEGDGDESSDEDADDSGGVDDDSGDDADDSGAMDDTVDDDDAVGGDGFHENIPPYSGWVAGLDGLLRFDQESAELLDYPDNIYKFDVIHTSMDRSIAVGISISEVIPNTLWEWNGTAWEMISLPASDCEPWSAGILDAETFFVACYYRVEIPDDDYDDDETAYDSYFELWRSVADTWDIAPLDNTEHAGQVECHDGVCLWIAEESYFITASGLTQIGSGSPLAGDTGSGDMVMASDTLGLLRFMEDNEGARTAFLYEDGAYTDVNDLIEGLPHRFYSIFTGYVLDESTVAFSDTTFNASYIYSPAAGWRVKEAWPIVIKADFAVGEAVFAIADDDGFWIFYDGLWLRRPDVDAQIWNRWTVSSISVSFED